METFSEEEHPIISLQTAYRAPSVWFDEVSHGSIGYSAIIAKHMLLSYHMTRCWEMEPYFFVKNGGSIFYKKLVSYDTGHFSLKIFYRIWILRVPTTLLLFLRAISHLCTENIPPSTERKTVIDDVIPHIKNVVKPNMRNSESKMTRMQLDCAVVEPIIALNYISQYWTSLFPVCYHIIFISRKMKPTFFINKQRLHLFQKDGVIWFKRPLFQCSYVLISCSVMRFSDRQHWI